MSQGKNELRTLAFVTLVETFSHMNPSRWPDVDSMVEFKVNLPATLVKMLSHMCEDGEGVHKALQTFIQQGLGTFTDRIREGENVQETLSIEEVTRRIKESEGGVENECQRG